MNSRGSWQRTRVGRDNGEQEERLSGWLVLGISALLSVMWRKVGLDRSRIPGNRNRPQGAAVPSRCAKCPPSDTGVTADFPDPQRGL